MKYLLIAAASAALLTAVPMANSQTKGMELGMLDCKVEGGAGFIIGSTKEVLCTYQPADKNIAPENYNGTISKIGLDVVNDPPDVFANIIRTDTARWAKVIADAGIKAGE